MATALQDQDAILKDLLKVGRLTEFGKAHGFDKINTYEEFKQAVPIRDYESFKPFIEKIKEGKHNILWKGKPIYLAKTSGTTSGSNTYRLQRSLFQIILIRHGTPSFAICPKPGIPLSPMVN